MMLTFNRAFRGRLQGSEQSGFSLIELIVAMGIFSIFIAIFTVSVANLARGTSRAQTTAEASTGVLVVFQNLDRQVRYADAVNFPGSGPSGARYIEFRRDKPMLSGPDVPTCTQWRFLPDEARIEMREWEAANTSTTTSWATKVTNVVDQGGPTYPFEMIPASVIGATKQQMVLTLQAGNEATGAGASMTTSFVARNSSVASVSNADANGDGQSDHLVCDRTGLRP